MQRPLNTATGNKKKQHTTNFLDNCNNFFSSCLYGVMNNNFHRDFFIQNVAVWNWNCNFFRRRPDCNWYTETFRFWIVSLDCPRTDQDRKSVRADPFTQQHVSFSTVYLTLRLPSVSGDMPKNTFGTRTYLCQGKHKNIRWYILKL